MKKNIFLLIALYVHTVTLAQNKREECYSCGSSCLTLTTDTTKLYKDIDYKRLTTYVWKLDQMYINEVASSDKDFANVSLVISADNRLIWIRKIEGQNRGKDYPVKFSFVQATGSTSCLLSLLTTYHKNKNNIEMDTYQIVQLSNKSMILTSRQLDKVDPSFYHNIEYRFVPQK